MENSEIFLFLLGLISTAVIVLIFSIPLFFFGIYKNVKKTRELIEELLKEIRVANYLKLEEDKEENPHTHTIEENIDTNGAKLHEIFLSAVSDELNDVEIEMEDKQ